MADSTSQVKDSGPLYSSLQQWDTTQLPVLYNANRRRVLRQEPYHGAVAPPIPSPLSNISSDQVDSIDFSAYYTPLLVRSLYRAIVQHKPCWTNGTNLREVALSIFRSKTQEIGLICYFSRKHNRVPTANDHGSGDGPLIAQSPAPLIICDLVTQSFLLDLSPGFTEPTEGVATSAGVSLAHDRNALVIDVRKLDGAAVGDDPESPQQTAGYFIVNIAPAPFFLNRDNILRDRVAGPLPDFTVIETGDTVLFWWGSEAAIDYNPSKPPLDISVKSKNIGATGGSENNGSDKSPPRKKPKINGGESRNKQHNKPHRYTDKQSASPLASTAQNSTNQGNPQIHPGVHGTKEEGLRQESPAPLAHTASNATGTQNLPSHGFCNLGASCHLNAALILLFCHPSIHEYLTGDESRVVLALAESQLYEQNNGYTGLGEVHPIISLWQTLYEPSDSGAAFAAQPKHVQKFLSTLGISAGTSQDAGETFANVLRGFSSSELDQRIRINTANIRRSTSGCGHTVEHKDSAVLWLLAINEHTDVQSCIDAWSRPEEIAEKDAWRCISCHDKLDEEEKNHIENTHRTAVRSIMPHATDAAVAKIVRERVGVKVKSESLQQVQELPDSLFLQFQRFLPTNNPAEFNKDSRRVNISERIRIPIGNNESFEEYDLCGVVIHGGPAIENGHYVAAIRNPAADTSGKNAWMVYNDKACAGPTYIVNEKELNEFLHTKTAPLYSNQVPYILSYSRAPDGLEDLFEGGIDETEPDQGQHSAPDMQEGSPRESQKGQSQEELETPSQISTSSPGGSHPSHDTGSSSPTRLMIPPAPSIGFANKGSTCHLSASLALLFSHPRVRYFMDNANLDNLRSFTHDNSVIGEPMNLVTPLEPICDLWELMQHRQPEWRIWWRAVQGIIICTLLKNLRLHVDRQEDAAETLQGILFEVGAHGTLGSIATFTQHTFGNTIGCGHNSATKQEPFTIWMLPIKGFNHLTECINQWGTPGEATDFRCQTCGVQRDADRIAAGQSTIEELEEEKQKIRDKVLTKYPNKTPAQLEDDVRDQRGVPRQLSQVQMIDNYPEVLLIQLKRFGNNNEQGDRTYQKISDYCEIPARFTIDQEIDLGISRTYVLCGVIAHIGHSMDHGHYVTMIRVDMTNGAEAPATWRLYDDDKVNPPESGSGREEEDTDITTDSQLNKYLYQKGRTPYVLSYRSADTIYMEREVDSTEPSSSDSTTDSHGAKTRMQKIRELQSHPPPRLQKIVVNNYPNQQILQSTGTPDISKEVTPPTTQSPRHSEPGSSVTSQTSHSPKTPEGEDTPQRPEGPQGNDGTHPNLPSDPAKSLERDELPGKLQSRSPSPIPPPPLEQPPKTPPQPPPPPTTPPQNTPEPVQPTIVLPPIILPPIIVPPTGSLPTVQTTVVTGPAPIGPESLPPGQLSTVPTTTLSGPAPTRPESPSPGPSLQPPVADSKPTKPRKRPPRGQPARKTYCPICKTMIHNLKDEKKVGHLQKHKEKPDLKDCFWLTSEEHKAWNEGGPTPGDELRKGEDGDVQKDEGAKEGEKVTKVKKRNREDGDEGGDEGPGKRQKGNKQVTSMRTKVTMEDGDEGGEGETARKKRKAAKKHPASKKPAEKMLPEKRPPSTKPTKSPDNKDPENHIQNGKPDKEEESDEEQQPKKPKRKRRDSEGEEEYGKKPAGKHPAAKHPAGKKPAQKGLPAGKRLPEKKPKGKADDDDLEQPKQDGKEPAIQQPNAEEEAPQTSKRKRRNSEGEEEYGGKKRKGNKSDVRKGSKSQGRAGSQSQVEKGSQSEGRKGRKGSGGKSG